MVMVDEKADLTLTAVMVSKAWAFGPMFYKSFLGFYEPMELGHIGT